MTASPVEIIIYVSSSKLREMFNQSQYPDLIREHKLAKEIVKSRLLDERALAEKGFPAGTKTETIIYRNSADKELYVKIHQYVFPDGTLGGSGRPDPKAILLDGKMYCFSASGG